MYNLILILMLGFALVAAPKKPKKVKQPLTEAVCRAKNGKKAQARCLAQLEKERSVLPAAPTAFAALDGGAAVPVPALRPAALPRSEPVELLPFAGEPANCLDSRRVVWLGFVRCMSEKKHDMRWEWLPIHPARKPGMETSAACTEFANANADALYLLGYGQCEALKGADLPPRALSGLSDGK